LRYLIIVILAVVIGGLATFRLLENPEKQEEQAAQAPSSVNEVDLARNQPATTNNSTDTTNANSTPAINKTPTEPLTPLQTKELKIGASKQATEGRQVSFHIIVKLRDGRVVFDSYKEGRPWQGVVGNGSILTGIDKGIRGMYQGGKRALWIPSYMAFGPSGVNPQVPPNANLYAEVELLSVF
jgi:FKBP-type peptidyl-prolyl cis-trans isomerase